MRLLFGIIIGGFLTVGGAYLYDSRNTSQHTAADSTQHASAQRPLVNWDVVDVTWHRLSAHARKQWRRVIANVDAEQATEPAPPRS